MRAMLLALLALAAPLSAALPPDESDVLKPHCGGPFQLCGYFEGSTRTPRIPFRYEIARPFSEGLAAVRIAGLYGYIDRTGKLVITPRFKAAGAFRQGYAEVRNDEASGIIDRTGRLVVPMRFNRIMPFDEGAFIAEPLVADRPAHGPQDGLLPGPSDSLAYTFLRGAGIYHIHKRWLTGQDLQFDAFDDPDRGLVWARRGNGAGEEEWGLLRADGSWQVSPRYNHVQTLEETHAVVAGVPDSLINPKDRRASIRWGAVDRNGALVVPLKFEHLSYWRGGYGYATKGGQSFSPDGTPRAVLRGIVGADGSLLANRYFDEVDIRDDGTLPRARSGGRWYSIDPTGKLLVDQLEGRLLVKCPSGLALFQRGGFIEFRRGMNGKSIGLFDRDRFFRRDCAEPFKVKREGKWYLIMQDGVVLGSERGFDEVYPFYGDFAAVDLNGKWGIIDRKGNFSVQPSLPRLQPASDGRFKVGEGTGAYWINGRGERVQRPAPSRPDPSQALRCRGGLTLFEEHDLWGLQDSAGVTVIEPRFRALSCFENGVSWTASPGQSVWCPIGPDGRIIPVLGCSPAYYPMIATESSPEVFNSDPYENSVLWNRAWLDYRAGKRAEAPKWVSRFGMATGMEGGPMGSVPTLWKAPYRDRAYYALLAGGVLVAAFAFRRKRLARPA